MKSKLLTAAAIVIALAAGHALASAQPPPPDAALAAPHGVPTSELAAVFDAAPAPAPAAEPLELAPDDPGVPNPTEDAGGFMETLYDWWAAGRLKPAIILALWGLALLLASKVDWLGVGRRAVIMAGLIEGLTDLVARAAAGVSITWGLIFSGLVTAVLAILSPTKKG